MQTLAESLADPANYSLFWKHDAWFGIFYYVSWFNTIYGIGGGGGYNLGGLMELSISVNEILDVVSVDRKGAGFKLVFKLLLGTDLFASADEDDDQYEKAIKSAIDEADLDGGRAAW